MRQIVIELPNGESNLEQCPGADVNVIMRKTPLGTLKLQFTGLLGPLDRRIFRVPRGVAVQQPVLESNGFDGREFTDRDMPGMTNPIYFMGEDPDPKTAASELPLDRFETMAQMFARSARFGRGEAA